MDEGKLWKELYFRILQKYSALKWLVSFQWFVIMVLCLVLVIT